MHIAHTCVMVAIRTEFMPIGANVLLSANRQQYNGSIKTD
jgi:hypothetical protein